MFIEKEKFVKIGRDTLCEDSFMRLKFNNDLLFYKMNLKAVSKRLLS